MRSEHPLFRLFLAIVLNVALALPAFAALTDNGDGTVTDSQTGLIWMRCAMGQTWSGTTCTGTAAAYTWAQATALTHTFAGHGDWRLPKIRELKSIVDVTQRDPAIDGSAFPATPLGDFWSGSPYADSSNSAWYGDFSFGGVVWYYRYDSYFVRLVRAGQSFSLLNDARPSSDYVDWGDGTVTHVPTGQTWMRCALGQTWNGSTCTGAATTYTWAQAKALTLTYAGRSDWRLPNIQELGSLVDFTQYRPAINAHVFPATASDFWSSSSISDDTWWVVHFDYGYDGGNFRGEDAGRVRLVSAGQSIGSSASATEYYHAGFGHYFVTGSADEAAAIDSGVIKGWARTGQTYTIYSQGGAGLSPVCRFFSTSFAPKSSHFYTPSAAECGTLKSNPNWQFESNAFYVKEPAGGACASGTVPLYRIYNNGHSGAPNHRYTTCATLRDNMISRGWVSEGVAMCVPGGSADCATDNSGGGIDYNAAPTATPPAMPAITPPSGTVGVAYSVAYTATGSAPIGFSAVGLPPGLSMSSSGLISGSPTQAGTYTGIVTASNGTAPNATQSFTMVIQAKPASCTGGDSC